MCAQETRLYSADGVVFLIVQADGNMVLCVPHTCACMPRSPNTRGPTASGALSNITGMCTRGVRVSWALHSHRTHCLKHGAAAQVQHRHRGSDLQYCHVQLHASAVLPGHADGEHLPDHPLGSLAHPPCTPAMHWGALPPRVDRVTALFFRCRFSELTMHGLGAGLQSGPLQGWEL